MNHGDIEELVIAFETRTLDKARWNHEAHLAVCWHTVRRLGRDAALAHLRHAIAAYNEATGGTNTPTSGYHETLTRYYVDAVAALADRPLADVLRDPTCSREAPLRLWSRTLLMSTSARLAWVPPDLVSTPAPR